MTILGIESSCDETAAAVYTEDGLQSNVIASQAIHRMYGGVVPELASRAHHKTIWATVQQGLDEAGITIEQVDVVAVTQGPGLMGALLVGVCFAKGFSLSQNIPIIGVNHIDAHAYANFIEDEPVYPFIALIVSGGHTRLVQIKSAFKHNLMGQTRDDAAGEAFDKIGKILGLSYPAGSIIDEKAKSGNPHFYDFPQSMLDGGFEFSFSGLKTSVLYFMQQKANQDEFLADHLEDICASVCYAITEVLIKKLTSAVEYTGVKTIVLAGGVAANSILRRKVKTLAAERNLNLHIPKIEYCTDNAAMIAVTGYLMAQRKMYSSLHMKPFASL